MQLFACFFTILRFDFKFYLDFDGLTLLIDSFFFALYS